MMYWGAHFEVGVRLDHDFGLESLQSNHCYNPIGPFQWEKHNFPGVAGDFVN
jgi:hypothetical protein